MVEEIHWWQSKTVWTSIVGFLFSIAVMLGFDVEALGLSEEATIGAVMAVVTLLTGIFRARTSRVVTKSPTP